jgi:hypothetical protein
MKSFEEYLNEAEVANDAPPPANPKRNLSKMYGALPKDSSQLMFNAQHLMTIIIDKYPNDLRRLLRRMINNGEFENDPSFKAEMNTLYESLTSGKMKSSAKRMGRLMKHKNIPSDGNKDKENDHKNVVSRPSSDGPSAEAGGGAY